MNATTLTLVCIALGGWALVVYSYAGYPVLLALVAALHQLKSDLRFVLGKAERRRQASANEAAHWPDVAAFMRPPVGRKPDGGRRDHGRRWGLQ